MTYATEIKKVEMMPFAEVFELTSGNRVFLYTSSERDFTFQSNLYKAAVIKRTVPTEDESFKPTRMTVTMPIVDPVNEYLANTPIEPTLIKITRVFIHDPTAYEVIFFGEIIGVNLVEAGDQGVASADCESGTIYFRNKIPRVTYQAFCNNVLYKASESLRPNCNVNKDDFKTTAIITISGNTISSASFDALADGWFIGGHVETVYGDFRYITDHVGPLLTLNIAFDARLVTGATIYAFPGCDKAPPTCRDKFNNFDNFQGFPYIPSNNPTVWGAK